MSNENKLTSLVQELASLLTSRKIKMATAESCTGGLVAKVLTDLAGSSAWFDRGLVTYSNEAKQELLNVTTKTLDEFGAVSEQTVIEMVNGLLSFTEVSIGVAISGIAGPTGGTNDKPVGTVWIAWKLQQNTVQTRGFVFAGDREQVRHQAAVESVKKLIEMLKADQ